MKRGSVFLISGLFILYFCISFSSASQWVECIADSDCATSNGYPPYWFCSSNVCTNACVRNSDCRTGGFCGIAGTCIAKLADHISCNAVTFLHTTSEEDAACNSGFCDNDGQGNADDYWCYSPVSTYLDNQENKCEFDISSGFEYKCDELTNGMDCPNDTTGRGYWCNLNCARENKDLSQTACRANGLNCNFNNFIWVKSGEAGKPVAPNQWEYPINDISNLYCCGDDTLEINRSRKTNCVPTNCQPNDYPSFSTSLADKACCDSATDCVVNWLCYASSLSSSHTVSNEVLVCDSGVFFDCDTKQSYCETACGKKWTTKGSNETGLLEYDSDSKLECCGDDSSETYVDSRSFQGHAPSDVKCCNGNDCVLNGKCQLSYQNGGNESQGGKCYNKIDDDCDGATDFCDGKFKIGCSRYDGLDPDCAATININVKDTLNLNVEGASVKVMTMFRYHEYYNVTTFYATTDAFGNAGIVVYGNSSYDLVIEKKGYYMSSNITKDLPLGFIWNLNAVMTRDVECNPDCTKLANNLCQSDCEGSNGCHFNSTQIASLCNNKAKYILMSYDATHEVECCEGAPKLKQISNAPKVEITGANLVYRLTKPIWYRGKLVQMIIAVADQAIQ